MEIICIKEIRLPDQFGIFRDFEVGHKYRYEREVDGMFTKHVIKIGDRSYIRSPDFIGYYSWQTYSWQTLDTYLTSLEEFRENKIDQILI